MKERATVAQPDETAGIVAFASDEARHGCGALLEVNGGEAVS